MHRSLLQLTAASMEVTPHAQKTGASCSCVVMSICTAKEECGAEDHTNMEDDALAKVWCHHISNAESRSFATVDGCSMGQGQRLRDVDGFLLDDLRTRS